MRPAMRRTTSSETPASRGVPGPGETTTWLGDHASASSAVTASFRSTRTSAPAVAM